MLSVSKLAEIRQRIRGEEKSLLSKFSDRVARVERWRPWFAGIGVVGALIAAVARIFTGGLGLGLTILGLTVAAVAGGLVVLMDYKKLEIGREAQTAHELAEEALTAAEDAEAASGEMRTRMEIIERNATGLDRQRRARLRAMRLMIETVEAAVLRKEDVGKTAEKMLNVTSEHIRLAVGVDGSDDFSISIFRCESSGEREHLRRVGCFSTVPGERNYDDLTWDKGRGYAGTLWHEATANTQAELILPDTTLPELRGRYPVDNPDLERDARYISVASYPILIRRSQNVWGVVIAVINRRGVFARVENRPTQGVELVEDISYVAALLAGLGTGKAD